jgi:hypothetical protein
MQVRGSDTLLPTLCYCVLQCKQHPYLLLSAQLVCQLLPHACWQRNMKWLELRNKHGKSG